MNISANQSISVGRLPKNVVDSYTDLKRHIYLHNRTNAKYVDELLTQVNESFTLAQSANVSLTAKLEAAIAKWVKEYYSALTISK